MADVGVVVGFVLLVGVGLILAAAAVITVLYFIAQGFMN